MIDDPVEQSEQGLILELAPVYLFEHPVVDRLEVALDVKEQCVRPLAGQGLQTLHGRVDAPAPATREGVVDQPPIEYRIEYIANRVMHYPVPIGGRADPPQLRLAHEKCPVRLHPVAPVA